MTTKTDQTVYEAELGGDAYIQVFDDRDEAIDGFTYTADPSRTFFDMPVEERWEAYIDYVRRFTEMESDFYHLRSVEEYEDFAGRSIAPYDEWLPDVYDAELEAEGWKRVSDWNERGICKVISIAN